MQLPVADRVLLAERLLLTLGDGEGIAVDQTQLLKYEQRLAELLRGDVEGISSEEALRRARASLAPAP